MTIPHGVPWYFLLRIDLLLALLPIVLLIWLSRRKRQSLPRPIPKASRTARLAEAIALGGMSVAMLTMLMWYRCYDRLPYPLTEDGVPRARVDYWTLLVICLAVVGGMVLLARFRSPVLAAVVLIAFFCGVGYAVNDGDIFWREAVVDEIRAIPVPIEICLDGDVEGADVWFNDVHIGKTPILADVDELLRQVPDWQQAPEEWTDFDKMYRYGKNGLLRPLAWFHLRGASKVTFDDPEAQERTIYARVELNGEQMYSENSHAMVAASRRNGYIVPGYVHLRMILPRWEEQIDLLVQQARLNDYEVGAGWIEAADSYADRMWQVLRFQTEVEPEFQGVIDTWVRHRYRLDRVVDHDYAFQVFQQIVAEADKRQGYHTDSLAGRAVDLILPHLDPEIIVETASQQISAFRLPPNWGAATYGRGNSGRFQFGTYPSRRWHAHHLTAGAFVWAHAIWQLDALLDREDDREDNLIEERITPALLRLQPLAQDGGPYSLAAELGGSVYDRIVQPPILAQQIPMYITGVEVDHRLYTNAGLDTPAGRVFRRENAHRILEMTERIVRDSLVFQTTWSPGKIDYLFLDVDESADNLAVQFWPRFDRFATIERHSWDGAAEIRWHYLARMWPHCTCEMFVDVYRPYCDLRVVQGSHSALLLLEPEFRFEVLTALIEEAERCLEEGDPRGIRGANLDDFTRLALQVPIETSADRLLEWLQVDSPERERRMSQVTRWCRSDDLSDHHLRVLTKAADPALRRLVLSSIRARPTPERRAILDLLLEDEDDGVRQEAEQLRDDLENLRRREVVARK